MTAVNDNSDLGYSLGYGNYFFNFNLIFEFWNKTNMIIYDAKLELNKWYDSVELI